jgi:RNA polymerase sigma-70 factor (sigma-E family)
VADWVEQEFTSFVTVHLAGLLRVAHALTGDPHAAEDLVQGALAKAFVNWRRIRGEPEPYVRQILYRDGVSRWRRLSRRPETPMAVPPETVGTAHRDDPHLRLLLQKALLALPPRQRAVLVLRYLEDLTVEETAEILGCRPGTVVSQASRALSKLRHTAPTQFHPEVQR